MNRSEIKSIIESIMFAYGEPISIKELNYAINEDLSPAGIFGPFSYDNRFNIEFGCGLAYKDGKLYLTYAEDDAIALIVKFDANIIINLPYVDQNELYSK